MCVFFIFFFFKQKTAYEMRISDWSSDVCSSDLGLVGIGKIARDQHLPAIRADDRYELVATASRHAQVDGVPGHADIAAMIAGDHRLGDRKSTRLNSSH